MIPPKQFDSFSPYLGDAEKVPMRSDFEQQQQQYFIQTVED